LKRKVQLFPLQAIHTKQRGARYRKEETEIGRYGIFYHLDAYPLVYPFLSYEALKPHEASDKSTEHPMWKKWMKHLIKDWRRKGWIGGVTNQTMSWTGPKTLHEVIRQM